jgi:GT2 family glycosyltransferase
MQARVTAVIVARSGAAHLERTLSGLARQSRLPDTVIAVDAGSTDGSAALLAASGPTQLVTVSAKVSFGSAVSKALQLSPVTDSDPDSEWLWLLADDNAPTPGALAQLLGAVEIAPSVAIAGPKLMRIEQPDVIAGFGETLSYYGASIQYVDGELDQAQHDIHDDVLGVAAGGMLVRRSLWVALGGFDPSLPSIDAALDFSVRTRLAGYRVVVVPGAKVLSNGGPELFGRRSVSERRRARIARTAQLHRRLVYAAPLALVFHWLSLVPLAFLRALGQLVAKRPGYVLGEFTSAFSAAFAGGVFRARRNLRRTRKLGWSAIAPLRMPPAQVRERRGQAREESLAVSLARGKAAPAAPVERPAGFVSHGGLWVLIVTAVLGAVVYGRLIGASSVVGGNLLPLSGSVAQLWANVGYGWREIGVGFTGAADPFAYVLALFGSITFWSPSVSIVAFYFLALPLSALGAWFAVRRITVRPWLPSVVALLFAVAPPLLDSLNSGHLGAAIAHVALPWLMLAALSATRSWAAAAGAALLFAVVAASAPSLVPVLLLLWIALMLSRPSRIIRMLGMPIPALALFAPLVVQQVARGNPLALLADPGVPAGGTEASALHLALVAPTNGLNGWVSALTPFSLPHTSIVIIVAALLAPVGILALAGLFVPGSRRAIPAMVIAFLGFVTAVGATHIHVSLAGDTAVAIWPGAALSLFWLGLLASAAVALDGIRFVAAPLGALAAFATVVLALPLVAGLYLGTAGIEAGSRMLPAVVTASGQSRPRLATLVLVPAEGKSLTATIQRGTGVTLDDQSTLAATDTRVSAATKHIATLAGNLASRSGFDATAELSRFSIGFVLLRPAASGQAAVHKRVSVALDGNALFTPVGTTSNGELWRFVSLPKTDAAVPSTADDRQFGRIVIIGQAVIFGITLLLGIPTVRRRRRGDVSGSVLGEPAGTFDEDDHD